MERAQFVELLQALSSPDNAVRQKAETMYQQAKANEPDTLVIGMVGVLAAPEVGDPLRRHVAVLMRNLCQRGPAKDFIFSKLSQPNKEQVASSLLGRYEAETVPGIQRKIGDIIVGLTEYVCDKEDPRGHLIIGSPNGWPALLPFVFRMANPAINQKPESCESALRLLKDLSHTLLEDIVEAQQDMGTVLQNALANSWLKMRVAALLLVCEFVQNAEKRAWTPLLATAGVLQQVLRQLVQEIENDEDWLLHELLKALIDTAMSEPDFFKVQLKESMEPAQLLAGIAKTRGLDSGVRGLSLEWLVTYTEKRTKWLTKNLAQFPALALEVCMQLMLEVDDDDEDIEAWAGLMFDEEGEEDVDELFHAGRDAIDRVMRCVGMEAFGQPLFQLIERFSMQQEWQARHAALSAIKQTVEYVEEKPQLDALTRVCLQNVNDAHPRVRYTALHALGQMANDQSPHFQEAWHETLMPVLMTMMDDRVDRVASMAMSAFVSFGEDLDNSLMMGYAHGFMEKLVQKLQTTSHRGVREESITAIAVIAGVTEKEFGNYYDGIMPILKQLIVHATGAKENRLRGKAFECLSLLGLAVGKERFLPDAREALEAMARPSEDTDDVQREYIKEAMERIVECLKKDFAPFLPQLLPPLLQKLSLQEDDNYSGYAGPEDYVQVCTGDGDMVWVRSEKLQELQGALRVLHKIVDETESAFFDFVPTTAQALLPLLSTTDEMTMLCDEVRSGALVTWALLVKSARLGAEERSQQPELMRELLRTGLQNAFGVMDKTEDPDALAAMASGLAECLRSIGSGFIGSAEVLQLVDTLFKLIDASAKRSLKNKKMKEDYIASNGPIGDDEEDDEDAVEKPEEQCRRNYEEVLGAIMQAAPQEFQQCLPACSERIGRWLQSKDHQVLGLYLSCDLLKELRERSESVWPVFMPEVFKVLGERNPNPDARCAAAYCVNIAATLPNFSTAATEAFRLTGQLARAQKPKKRDNRARLAHDNVIAALLSLARCQSSHCPAEVNAWDLVLSNLPLRDDEEEAKKVHESLVDLLLEQHPALVGAFLGKVLPILAEVYRTDDICTKATDEKIKRVFSLLPRDALQAAANGFTEKQKKKIEKMLAGG